ncbi:anti-sigma factor [Paenibacillus qinlingensis]|uniref:Anti-sigma-W factor RsiW n=1 Tax=Paenibacillus qinlingensis TaxID=1837343 RepID=A0ABU1NRT6_9BACL|nr:anti-sigma factor [Paenibacillus qinlingensis]MDR6550197.1 hypothetical protein [Paenibacillus qinlingensis]
MEEREHIDCSFVVNYLTGDCTEWERAAFERHLRTCVACREELHDLEAVWEALPFDMEEVEVPPDLKEQVMSAIVPNRHDLVIEMTTNERSQNVAKSSKGRLFKWAYACAAVVLIGVAGGLWWNNQEPTPSGTLKTALNQPAEIESIYQLKSVETTMSSASGTVWVLQHGDVHNVVVNLQGLKETEGDWTYQVWYNRNGKRYNCGTLRVDTKGAGMLTYTIPVKTDNLQIDSFGVTLEPDPNGTTPRGKKILGT